MSQNTKPIPSEKLAWLADQIFVSFPRDVTGLKCYVMDCGCIYYQRLKDDELVQKYPNDDDIQTLHALRVGLCLKIEQGSITFEQATDIFNRAHDMVIEKTKADQKKGEPKL